MYYFDDSLGDDRPSWRDGRAYSPLLDWMRDVLVRALTDQGCPNDTADELAKYASLRTGEGLTWELDVEGNGYLAEGTDVSREEFAAAATAMAEMLRTESAERIEERRSGEDSEPPYWDVSGQR